MATSDAIAMRAIPLRRRAVVLIVSGGMFILPLNRIGENFGQTVFFDYLPISEGFLPGQYEISWGSFRTFFQIGWLFLKEALIKSHRGRCGKP
jgi:hypothetical protein